MSSDFHRILVPLDGSGLAEAVLPFVIGFASRLGASLTLLHVLERRPPDEVHGEPHLTTEGEAATYLERVAGRCRGAGVECEHHVHSPRVRGVAAAIAEHGDELGADLIAMTTHGSGGLRDLLVGSIAQQTLAHGTTPVLLVRPGDSDARTLFSCQTIVVALDPVAHGLAPLAAAQRLSRAFGARLHLVTVVPDHPTLPPERRTLARFSPHAAAAALDVERKDAEQTLHDASASLEAEGLHATSEMRRGQPLAEVARSVREQTADLLVVATHGRAGLDSLLSGGFAAGITSQTSVPVLLLRIGNGPGG